MLASRRIFNYSFKTYSVMLRLQKWNLFIINWSWLETIWIENSDAIFRSQFRISTFASFWSSSILNRAFNLTWLKEQMIKLLTIKKTIQIISQTNEIVSMTLINHHTTTSFSRHTLRGRKTEPHINFKIQLINIDSISIQNNRIDLFNVFCLQQSNRYKSSSKTKTRSIRRDRINFSETSKNAIKTKIKLM